MCCHIGDRPLTAATASQKVAEIFPSDFFYAQPLTNLPDPC